METPLLSTISNASSSSSSSEKTVVDISDDHSKKYDVFLSFASDDTEKNIVGQLRAAMSDKGIEAFVDQDQTPGDQYISPELARAIGDSACSVVILSASYASSSRCLEELVKILDCAKQRGQILIPVFCRVDASLLRKQVRSFAEAFVEHETTPLEDISERVHRWKVAITEVSGLSGFDLKNYRDEAHLIEEIVSEMSSKSENIVSSKSVEDHRSCVGKLLTPRGYGVKTFVGSIGAILAFLLVVFPIFGVFLYIVAPNVYDIDEERASTMWTLGKPFLTKFI